MKNIEEKQKKQRIPPHGPLAFARDADMMRGRSGPLARPRLDDMAEEEREKMGYLGKGTIQFVERNKWWPEICSSELNDILEVDDDFHLDVNDIFELERDLELIFI